MLGAIYLASIATNWWLFVFLYSFIFPIGIGLVYWPPIICCWEWFPEKKGFMTGLIIGAFGLGAFFFGFITTAIVNPGGIYHLDEDGPKPHYYPPELAERVPKMFQICLIIWGSLSLIAILCVSRNPYAKLEERNRKLEFLHGDQDKPITIQEAYTSTRFKKICVMFMFGTFYGLYMASAYKISADDRFIDD